MFLPTFWRAGHFPLSSYIESKCSDNIEMEFIEVRKRVFARTLPFYLDFRIKFTGIVVGINTLEINTFYIRLIIVKRNPEIAFDYSRLERKKNLRCRDNNEGFGSSNPMCGTLWIVMFASVHLLYDFIYYVLTFSFREKLKESSFTRLQGSEMQVKTLRRRLPIVGCNLLMLW